MLSLSLCRHQSQRQPLPFSGEECMLYLDISISVAERFELVQLVEQTHVWPPRKVMKNTCYAVTSQSSDGVAP